MTRNIREIVLPFDYQAERKIMGAIISGDSYLLNCLTITMDDFFMPYHKGIMEGIYKLDWENKPFCKYKLMEALNPQVQTLQRYLETIELVSIEKDELDRLCRRVRDCSIGRIVTRKIIGSASDLNAGEIDSVKFLQQIHASIFDAIGKYCMPCLAGIESCEIMDQLPELVSTGGWYVPLLSCLQTRWKRECEQLTETEQM